MNEKKINIVNFVRGCDPRLDSFEYLYRTAYEEIKMIKSYGFKHTYLLQYDAMLRSEIQELFLKEKDNNMELGFGWRWHSLYVKRLAFHGADVMDGHGIGM